MKVTGTEHYKASTYVEANQMYVMVIGFSQTLGNNPSIYCSMTLHEIVTLYI